jgi:acyl-CoA synthetase (AMP-forming)/AMP-acid ligase II
MQNTDSVEVTVVVAGNAMTCDYPRLSALVDEAAARFGDRLVWESIDDGSTLSFEAFRALTLKCASALRALGIGVGCHVAVMLPNVPAFVVTWMALARLGAVMVPINTRNTSRELQYVLRDSRAQALVIDQAYLDTLRGCESGMIPAARLIVHGPTGTTDAPTWFERVQAAAGDAIDESQVTADTLMSVQYTSGSTGFPKGCLLTQDYWIVLGYARASQGPAPTRLLIDKPMSYMGGMWRFLVCLHVGATACVARQFSLSGLQRRLVDQRIDFFSATDAVAKLPDFPGVETLKVAWISIGGLAKELHRPLERKFNTPVRELYGMTETGATLYMPADAGHMSGSGSCGVPAPFRECRIVDANGQDVARGEVGELWVRGRGILKGYFDKPQANAAAFSGEWFRTGDLFRQDEAGYYYIQGRIKDSIRRSAENISAHEVESVAAGVRGVLEVAAVGVADALRGQEVKLCLLLQPGETRDSVPPERVLAHCASRLAAFKVPRYLEYLAEFPRTSSNKIAKQELIATRGALYDRASGQWVQVG